MLLVRFPNRADFSSILVGEVSNLAGLSPKGLRVREIFNFQLLLTANRQQPIAKKVDLI